MIRALQICLYTLLGTLSLSLRAQTMQDESLKAGYLVNFLEFVEWDQAQVDGHRIGVLNSPRVAEKIKVIGLGRTCKHTDLPINVVNFDRAQDIHDLELLFVPRGEHIHWDELVRLSEQHKFILIGEEAGFLETGGSIQFVTVNNRLRFKINNQQAEKLGIRMSSKLLSLAMVVR